MFFGDWVIPGCLYRVVGSSGRSSVDRDDGSLICDGMKSIGCRSKDGDQRGCMV